MQGYCLIGSESQRKESDQGTFTEVVYCLLLANNNYGLLFSTTAKKKVQGLILITMVGIFSLRIT